MSIKNDKKESKHLLKKILYDLFIIIVSVSVLYFALAAYAGSLTPPAGSVAPAMKSLQEIYDVLAGTYNSSIVTPNANGNAMQILKCITTKINGGYCN